MTRATSTTESAIWASLFKETYPRPFRVTKRQFLAKHHDEVDEVEQLIEKGRIRFIDGKHLRLPLFALETLSANNAEATMVFHLCGHLFDVLRSFFIDSPEAKLSMSEIAKLADMSENKVARAFEFLLDTTIVEAHATDSEGVLGDIYLSPNILRHKAFADVIDALPGRKQKIGALTKGSTKPVERPHRWNVFISHASEDKTSFVRPLAEALRARGLTIWYDEHTLTVGDSLRQSIDDGLAKSRFGIVVISPNFLEKPWPQMELDGLVAREVDGVKVILPIYHEITFEQVNKRSPILAGKLAVSSAKGLEHVVARLLEAMGDAAPVSHSGKKRRSAIAVPTYGDRARADVDFPVTKKSIIGGLISSLRTSHWPTQNPAVLKLFQLDWTTLSADEAFVLGRNLYQVAEGGERSAIGILQDFRRHVASMDPNRTLDLLNGMLFEAYFDSKGRFRGAELKKRYLSCLLELREVKQFQPSVAFIRKEIKPYLSEIPLKYRFEGPAPGADTPPF
jgi:TIR domain